MFYEEAKARSRKLLREYRANVRNDPLEDTRFNEHFVKFLLSRCMPQFRQHEKVQRRDKVREGSGRGLSRMIDSLGSVRYISIEGASLRIEAYAMNPSSPSTRYVVRH